MPFHWGLISIAQLQAGSYKIGLLVSNRGRKSKNGGENRKNKTMQGEAVTGCLKAQNS